MFERIFGRKKEKARQGIGTEDLKKVVGEMLEQISVVGPDTPKWDSTRDYKERLLFLAGLPEDANTNFSIEDSKFLSGGVDLVEGGGSVAFTLAIGETSLLFLNKDAKKGEMIYKTEPLNKVSGQSELKAVLDGFVLLGPFPGEVFDISRETLEEKMKIMKEDVRPRLQFAKDIKRKVKK